MLGPDSLILIGPELRRGVLWGASYSLGQFGVCSCSGWLLTLPVARVGVALEFWKDSWGSTPCVCLWVGPLGPALLGLGFHSRSTDSIALPPLPAGQSPETLDGVERPGCMCVWVCARVCECDARVSSCPFIGHPKSAWKRGLA